MDELPPDTPDVLTLLEQAQAGDRRAFDDLFARFRDHLHQFIQRRLDPHLRSRLDVSDVVQETQLDVFRRLADYLERRPMPFHLWLRKTAYERLLMLRRQHVEAARRSVFREAALPDGSSLYLAQCLAQTGSTPSQQLSRRERARRVQQAVATLAAADQEILLMRNFENLSYQEVACLLDIDPAAARKRHGRALLRLHQALAACGVTESQL